MVSHVEFNQTSSKIYSSSNMSQISNLNYYIQIKSLNV